MIELDALREKIDEIDAQIVRLLEQRMDISREVGACKAKYGMPVLDEAREAAVIQSRIAMLQNKDNADALREIYVAIMRCSRASQEKPL